MRRTRTDTAAPPFPASSGPGKKVRHRRISTVTRDFAADWQRWHALERLGAIVAVAVTIATPMGVALAALVR